MELEFNLRFEDIEMDLDEGRITSDEAAARRGALEAAYDVYIDLGLDGLVG